MKFLPTDHRPHRPAAPAPLVWLLVACCIGVVIATAFPWTRVAFERLWGEAFGPLGWRTRAGFTCLTTCLLTVTVAGIEGHSPDNQHAARTAGTVLLAVALLAVAVRLWNGADPVGGLTGAHTGWFVATAVLVPIALGTAGWRLRATGLAPGHVG